MSNINHSLEHLAQRLRNCRSLPEFKLWETMSKSDFIRYQFQRQQLVGNYIVDMICEELKLVIEIDGDSHDLKYGQAGRYKKLKSLGLRVLRFSNNELKYNIQRVLQKIAEQIERLELGIKN